MTSIVSKIKEELNGKTFKLFQGHAVLKTVLKRKYDIIELVKLEAKSLKLITVTIGYNLVREIKEGEFEYSYIEFDLNKTDYKLDLVKSEYEVGAIQLLIN